MNTTVKKVMRILPDSAYISLKYFYHFKKFPNLRNPKTFNEKLQWLKLHERNSEYTKMVDKYEVKEYLAEKVGEEYVVPNLGVWDKFEDIDFNSLPDQFVLKCTHDCGGLVIVKDKSKLDIDSARTKINASLKRNYFWEGREWPYKNVKPRIIAEKYLEDARTGELPDYKFFCFDGKAKVLFIATERSKENSETKFDFYDTDFNHLPFTNGHPNADTPPLKPEKFEEMKFLAEKISQGIPLLRVDFYEVNGKIYFGELTFSHWSGMIPFNPDEWDYKLGEMIVLPK